MSEHTPGPWVAKQVKGFGANTFIWSAAPEESTYREFTYIAQDVSGHANARLIAAAPDLLEAAISCVSRMTEVADALYEGRVDQVNMVVGALRLEADRVSAVIAIAKAEGTT